MQTASATLTNALNNGHTLKATPRLIAEWNQNRYAGIRKIDNNPSEKSVGADVENFPITTIADVVRPKKRGIIKARASKAVAAPLFWPRSRARLNPQGEEGFTAPDFSDSPGTNRYYTVGADAGYKYWTSPAPSLFVQRSDGSYGFPSDRNVAPYILYKRSARTNKIVVTFESTWARPVDYSIQTTSNLGSTWQTVASNVVPDAEGRVVIYRQANNTWNTNVYRESVATINGIRLVVNSISRPSAQFNLIELSPRLERDLSEYVINYSTDFTLSESNFIAPVGTASSNVANVSLSNFDGQFNNENTGSIYYGLIDSNAEFTMDVVYDLANFGGGTESIREFTMHVDNWGETSALEMSATLKDSSKFLQEEKVPNILLENVTVGEAIWRICDSIGFTEYEYEKKDDDPSSTLRYFWTDSEKTVWETLQELAEATQTAIYFDEFDDLRIKTRESAFDLAKNPTWALEATNANKLADVVEATITADYEANVVNINYKDTKVSDDNRGFPEMHVLWQPEDSFVLRSSQLTRQLNATDMVLRIDPKEAEVWPFEGMMNIDGELIKYHGKEYQYYAKNGGLVTVWLYSNEDRINAINSLSDEANSYKNTYTGRLKIEERGVYWSSPRTHTVDLGGWGGRTVARDLLVTGSYNGGIYHDSNASVMRVTAPSVFGIDSLYTVTRGQPTDATFRRYGTRIRIPKSNPGRGGAGIVINSGDYDSGYYIEVVPSETINANGGALRNYIHEVGFFARHTNGSHHRLAGKGTPFVFALDKWYDLDVDFYQEASGAHNITVYIDGIAMSRIRLTSGRVALTGRNGFFHRGTGAAEFEHFYAHAGGEVARVDESSQFDRAHGGYVSGQWGNEYVYGTKDATRTVGGKNEIYKQKYNQYYFDEFGPICHEIREMDIIFEKYPVLHSRLYMTNDKIVCPEYNADPFGAKFLLGNSSRDNAIGEGEDLITFGAENPVTQHMMIYGRMVFQEEGQVYTEKNRSGDEINPLENEDSIRRRGRVEVDIDSKWIQSKAEAKSIARWILKHWSNGNDEVSVEMFGNPLIQIGDVVTLDYPAKNMLRTTHRYFVIGTANEFSQGLNTTLTLRRAKI